MQKRLEAVELALSSVVGLTVRLHRLLSEQAISLLSPEPLSQIDQERLTHLLGECAGILLTGCQRMTLGSGSIPVYNSIPLPQTVPYYIELEKKPDGTLNFKTDSEETS